MPLRAFKFFAFQTHPHHHCFLLATLQLHSVVSAAFHDSNVMQQLKCTRVCIFGGELYWPCTRNTEIRVQQHSKPTQYVYGHWIRKMACHSTWLGAEIAAQYMVQPRLACLHNCTRRASPLTWKMRNKGTAETPYLSEMSTASSASTWLNWHSLYVQSSKCHSENTKTSRTAKTRKTLLQIHSKLIEELCKANHKGSS